MREGKRNSRQSGGPVSSVASILLASTSLRPPSGPLASAPSDPPPGVTQHDLVEAFLREERERHGGIMSRERLLHVRLALDAAIRQEQRLLVCAEAPAGPTDEDPRAAARRQRDERRLMVALWRVTG